MVVFWSAPWYAPFDTGLRPTQDESHGGSHRRYLVLHSMVIFRSACWAAPFDTGLRPTQETSRGGSHRCYLVLHSMGVFWSICWAAPFDTGLRPTQDESHGGSHRRYLVLHSMVIFRSTCRAAPFDTGLRPTQETSQEPRGLRNHDQTSTFSPLRGEDRGGGGGPSHGETTLPQSPPIKGGVPKTRRLWESRRDFLPVALEFIPALRSGDVPRAFIPARRSGNVPRESIPARPSLEKLPGTAPCLTT